MTVETTVISASSVGNGVTTVFPLPFVFLDNSHIKVYFDSVLQGSGYAVSGAGNPAGGAVTFDDAPANGVVVYRLRDVPITQEVDTVNNETILQDVLDKALDKGIMIDQQLAAGLLDTTSRAILVPSGELGSTLAPVASRLGGGKVLAPNSVTGAIEVQAIDPAYTGPTGPANSTYANRAAMVATAPPTNKSAIVVDDGTFIWRATNSAALIAALPADFVASTYPGAGVGAWVRQGEGRNSLAAILSGVYTIGQGFPSAVYPGSYWIVKTEVILQNYFAPEPLDGSKVTFNDELHLQVNLVGGGTGVAECQNSSIQGYITNRVTELYDQHFCRSERKIVVAPVGQVGVFGDSIVYGQTGAMLAPGDWIPTGYGDGSFHQFAQVAAPFPAYMASFMAVVLGAGKLGFSNRGHSGDRVGSGYVRHQVSSTFNVAYICYGTNDVLYGTNNGINPENLFDLTPDPPTDFRFELFAPALRKFAYRCALRGQLPILVAPNVWSSLVGYDGTVWSAAKVSAMFRAAIQTIADEIGAGFVDLAECLNGYDNDYLTLDGVHLDDPGCLTVAARLCAPLVGKGWRYATYISGERKLSATPMYENMNVPAVSGADDMALVADTNSFSSPFVNATQRAALLVDTDRVFYSVYLEEDDMCVIPVGYIANGGTVNINLDFGVSQGKSKLYTLAGAGLGASVTYPGFQEYVAAGSTKIMTNPSELGDVLTIVGKGWHVIGIRASVQVLVLSGLWFGRWHRMSTAIAAPTGGATIDAQSRTAIGSILACLRQNNLLKT